MKDRKQKRAEAEERQRIRAQRTPEEQLTLLSERGIESGAEWDRLVAQVEKKEKGDKA